MLAGRDRAGRRVERRRGDEQPPIAGGQEHAVAHATPGRRHADHPDAMQAVWHHADPLQRHQRCHERITIRHRGDHHVRRIDDAHIGPEHLPGHVRLAGADPHDLHLGIHESVGLGVADPLVETHLHRAAVHVEDDARLPFMQVAGRANDARHAHAVVMEPARGEAGRPDGPRLGRGVAGQDLDRGAGDAVDVGALEDRAPDADSTARLRRDLAVREDGEGGRGLIAEPDMIAAVGGRDHGLDVHRAVRCGLEERLGDGAERRQRRRLGAGGGAAEEQGHRPGEHPEPAQEADERHGEPRLGPRSRPPPETSEHSTGLTGRRGRPVCCPGAAAGWLQHADRLPAAEHGDRRRRP
jgi:hypothetical protein